MITISRNETTWRFDTSGMAKDEERLIGKLEARADMLHGLHRCLVYKTISEEPGLFELFLEDMWQEIKKEQEMRLANRFSLSLANEFYMSDDYLYGPGMRRAL